ncbi:O-antigen ligase [Tamilnaduibacter salinus]|uniref:O-antigen ligase n=1 Tax=Tamilnaduibacter salinus TaxID=1484056 RepID=A0A2U1CZW6_9GAMM|nr:O-antigen ligase family protein [Tamilnaduibacter salinus]PVY78317.1 O-antigen ligase [Tamilnaduibacter salinus]
MSKVALLFLLVFVGGSVAALFYSSHFAFLVYQITYFLNPVDRWWGSQLPGSSYSFVAAVLMILVLAFRYRSLTEKGPWLQHPSLKWLVAILASYYLAYLWALVPSAHDKFTFIFLKLTVVILVAYKLLDSQKALNASIWAYVIGATYIGYLATSMGRNAGYRLEGIKLPETGDVNPVAAAIVPAGVLLLYQVWMGNKTTKVICMVAGALVANALVLFNSRGAFLGIVVSVGLYLMAMMFSRHRQKGQRGIAVVVVIAGLSGGYYVTDDVFWERMGTLENLESRESGAGRMAYWWASVEMIAQDPKGLGVKGFNRLAPFYLSDEERGGTRFRAVHSMWFQALTEIGVHGFLFFVLLLFSLYRLSRRTKQYLIDSRDYSGYFKVLALECALVGYLVTASFINQFRAEILYWMILLVAVASKVHYLQVSESKEPENVEETMPMRYGPRLPRREP